mmetsp:Transcript_5863/g.16499  ORF Transcript_5863/g.16499 Transcript_5863/m.16499 type:complete len:111 (-) Transcript_5863:679-1011(-)
MSEEAKEEENEYYSDVKWSRDIWSVHEEQLKRGLYRAFAINKIGEKNATEQHRALQVHGVTIDATFTSYPTYNDWITGRRKSKKKLYVETIKVMESYISKADEAAKTTDV